MDSTSNRMPRSAAMPDTFERDRQQARELAREQQQRGLRFGLGLMGGLGMGMGMGMPRPVGHSTARTAASPSSGSVMLQRPAPDFQRLLTATRKYVPSHFLPQMPLVGLSATPRLPSYVHPHHGNDQPQKQTQVIGLGAPVYNAQVQPPRLAPPKEKRAQVIDLTEPVNNARPHLAPPKEKSTNKRTQQSRSSRSVSPQKRTQRTLRSNSPEKRHSKQLSAYEEFQNIQQRAAKSAVKPTKKRAMADNSADEPTKRVRRESFLQNNGVSQQAAPGAMKPTPRSPLEALHEQFRLQARPSANTDRGPMPPTPKIATTPNIMASTSSFMAPTPNIMAPTPNMMPSTPNIMAPPMLPPRQLPQSMAPSQQMSIYTDSLKKPANPLHRGKLPASKPIQEMLHKPLNARVTKQDYHTQHRRQPYATQEAQKHAQVPKADARAVLRQQRLQAHISQENRRRNAQRQGLHMLDLEKGSVAYDDCMRHMSPESRFGHLDGSREREPLPSVSAPGANDPAVHNAGEGIVGPSKSAAQKSSTDPVNNSAGASNNQDPVENAAEEPTRNIDEPSVPHDTPNLGANDAVPPERALSPFRQDELLEPYIDEDGFQHAPDPVFFTEQRADLEWMLQEFEQRADLEWMLQEFEQRDNAGWL